MPRSVFVIGIAMMVLLSATPVQADSPVRRDFSGESWENGLVDLRRTDVEQSMQVDSGLTGSALEVNIPAGSFRGLGPLDQIQGHPSEAWYRYHIQLLDFDSRSTGKLPGLAGLYSHTARGCRPSRPGAPGWSARGLFGAAGTLGAPEGHVPIGIYLYHLDQKGSCGDALFWDNSSLEPGRWHCIEGHVKLNTPGSPDGEITGWLDGTQRFSRTGLRFRRSGEAAVGIEQMWLNVYFGGRRPTPNNLRLAIDDVEVSTEGRVGCLDSSTDLVGWLDREGRPAIATYHTDTGEWVMKRWTGSSFEAESWGSYRTRADWAAHLVGDFDRDGRNEIASFHPSNGSWWVSRSGDDGPEITRWATFDTKSGWGSHLVGDFTGNGASEIASYHQGNGSWWVSSSPAVERELALRATSRRMGVSRLSGLPGDGNLEVLDLPPLRSSVNIPSDGGFVPHRWESFTSAQGWTSQLVGDFNGDGLDDIANYHPAAGAWWVSTSNGNSFTTTQWDTFSSNTGWTSQLVGDFNGDGLDDIANYHTIAATWWVSASTGESFITQNWTPR